MTCAVKVIGGFPPPTRGWTCKRRPVLARTLGFPAHAGMDPCQ